MTALSQRLRRGSLYALIVIGVLILLPPLFAHKLDAWEAAGRLVPLHSQVVEQCGTDAKIVLSRWLYSYRFSGDNAYAKFRGHIATSSCDRSFAVELERRNEQWTISRLEMH